MAFVLGLFIGVVVGYTLAAMMWVSSQGRDHEGD